MYFEVTGFSSITGVILGCTNTSGGILAPPVPPTLSDGTGNLTHLIISCIWVSTNKSLSFKANSNNYGCTIYSENQNSPTSDPSTFIPNIDFIAETTVVDRMFGPDGWEYNLPVFSYLAKYTDSQDVVFNVDKRIGGTWEELEDYAWKLAEPLGRTPVYSRSGTKRIDVNYGKKIKIKANKYLYQILWYHSWVYKDLFIKIRTRTIVKLLLFWFDFLWISLYIRTVKLLVPLASFAKLVETGWWDMHCTLNFCPHRLGRNWM